MAIHFVKDVLIHVLIEELHHRGEMIAILWQMDIQPPDMAWISVMKRQSPQQQGITNYFDVKSVQEYSAKSRKVGRQSYLPKDAGARYGLFCCMYRYRK